MSRSTWSRPQRWKNDIIYFAARHAIELGLALPRGWLPALGDALGRMAHAFLTDARRRTLENLALVYPDLDAGARTAFARDVFRSLGEDLTDTLALLDPTESPDRTLGITSESIAALESALGEGRGVVYVTCHLGPWERMAALLARLGFPITTLARESYDSRFHALVYERLRTARNVEAIYRADPRAPFAIVRALKRGRVLGFLVDLVNPRSSSSTARVEWLGRPSQIALGPARLALRTACPIVIGTPAPGTSSTHFDILVSRLATSDLEPNLAGEAALSQRIADALSERIRALPAHWPWMHPSFPKPVPALNGRSASQFRLVEWSRGHFL